MISRARPPATRPTRREPRRYSPGPWLVLFGTALALRLTLLGLASETLPGIPPRLHDVATSLAGGRGYSIADETRTRPTNGTNASGGESPLPEARRATAEWPPMTPMLLAAAYRSKLPHPWAGFLAIAVLGALAPLLVRWFAESVFGAAAGRAAGWACALDPLLVFAPPSSVQAVALGLALVLTLGLSAAWLKVPRGARALGVGVAFGLAALTGGPAVAVLPVLVAWAWVPLGLILPAPERMRQLLLVVGGMLAVLVPWTVRNAVAVRSFAPWSTSTGLALLAGNEPSAWGDPARRGGPVDVLAEPPNAARLGGLAEGRRDARATAIAASNVAEHAGAWPAATAAKLARFAWPGEESRPRGLPAPLWSLVVAAIAAWTALAVWGSVRALAGARRWYQSLPVLVAGAGFVVAAVCYGGLSARLPFEPVIGLMAGIGFDDARRRLRSWRRGLRLVRGRSAVDSVGRR